MGADLRLVFTSSPGHIYDIFQELTLVHLADRGTNPLQSGELGPFAFTVRAGRIY